MRRLAISLVLAFALAPAAAAAKEPVSATVCGASDCRTVTDKDSLEALIGGGAPSDPPKAGSGWYSVRIAIKVEEGRREHFSLVVVPSAGLMRAGDASEGYSWMEATPSGVREYRRVTRGVEAFPASALRGVGLPPARVDEVVLPPEERKAEPDGGSSPLPWIAGGLVLLGLAGAMLRWRGLPWPRPAQG
jgi:hypothetical protein